MPRRSRIRFRFTASFSKMRCRRRIANRGCDAALLSWRRRGRHPSGEVADAIEDGVGVEVLVRFLESAPGAAGAVRVRGPHRRPPRGSIGPRRRSVAVEPRPCSQAHHAHWPAYAAPRERVQGRPSWAPQCRGFFRAWPAREMVWERGTLRRRCAKEPVERGRGALWVLIPSARYPYLGEELFSGCGAVVATRPDTGRGRMDGGGCIGSSGLVGGGETCGGTLASGEPWGFPQDVATGGLQGRMDHELSIPAGPRKGSRPAIGFTAWQRSRPCPHTGHVASAA